MSDGLSQMGSLTIQLKAAARMQKLSQSLNISIIAIATVVVIPFVTVIVVQQAGSYSKQRLQNPKAGVIVDFLPLYYPPKHTQI